MNIQYVTDDKGNRIAVQIPLDQWEIIKAELESYDTKTEMDEILADPGLMESIRGGREQARRRIGRPLTGIDI